MSKIGIIVDGQGEFFSFKNRFQNCNMKILKTDGPRGHLAKVEDIIIHSKKQINILKCFGCTKAIILVDLEERSQDSYAFMQQAKKCIENNSFEIDTYIAVADRMIENWYLADILYLSSQKKYLKKQTKQKYYEGTNGKKELRKIFAKGYDYNEVTHGKELFNMMRFNFAKEYSKSLNDFLSLIEDI